MNPVVERVINTPLGGDLLQFERRRVKWRRGKGDDDGKGNSEGKGNSAGKGNSEGKGNSAGKGNSEGNGNGNGNDETGAQANSSPNFQIQPDPPYQTPPSQPNLTNQTPLSQPNPPSQTPPPSQPNPTNQPASPNPLNTTPVRGNEKDNNSQNQGLAAGNTGQKISDTPHNNQDDPIAGTSQGTTDNIHNGSPTSSISNVNPTPSGAPNNPALEQPPSNAWRRNAAIIFTLGMAALGILLLFKKKKNLFRRVLFTSSRRRLHEIDEWSTSSFHSDAQELPAPPPAQAPKNHVQSPLIDNSIVSNSAGSHNHSNGGGTGTRVHPEVAGLTRTQSNSAYHGYRETEGPSMQQVQSPNFNPFDEEMGSVEFPTPPERATVNWHDCMK